MIKCCKTCELHPTFELDGKAFTWKAYAMETPGLFKVETTKDKMASLCSKIYRCSDMTEEKTILCEGHTERGQW